MWSGFLCGRKKTFGTRCSWRPVCSVDARKRLEPGVAGDPFVVWTGLRGLRKPLLARDLVCRL